MARGPGSIDLTDIPEPSDVPVLSGHHLLAEVRLLRLHRRHDAGSLNLPTLTGALLDRLFQLLIIVLQRNTAEFGLTVAAIPIVLVLLIGAGLAVQREIKWYV